MAIKITLKNSVTSGSEPGTSDLTAVGELAINANVNSLGIWMRDSEGGIKKMAGPGSVTTPAASATAAGIAELATSAETITGTDTARVTTPAGVKAVTDAERTTSNNTYLALAGGTLTGVLAATAGSNSAPAVHFGDSDSGIFGGTNTVSLAAGGTTRLTADTGVTVVGTLAVTGAITSTSDITIADKIIHAGDTNTAIRFPAADTISAESGGTEALRVDSSQRLLVGLTSSRAIANLTTLQQIEGTDAASGLSITRNSASNEGGTLNFGKSRAAGIGGVTVVQDGDALGTINFSGADGTDLTNTAASIAGFINGTPGANDMPGKLVFGTTADGATSPTTRLTIDNAGVVNVPDTGKFTAGSSSDLSIYHDGSTASVIDAKAGDFLYIYSDNLRLTSKTGTEKYITGTVNGAVEIYHNDTKHFETTDSGAKFPSPGSSAYDIEVRTSVVGDASSIELPDHCQIGFGTNNDLTIYHDSNHTYLNNQQCELRVRSTAFVLEKEDGSDAVDVVGEDLVWKTPSGNLGKIDVISVGSGGPHGFGGAMRLYAKKDNVATPAEVVKIDSNGLACTGRLSAYVDATSIEGALFKNTNNGAAAVKMVKFTRHDGNEVGSITQSNSATAYNTSSDYRLKENEVAISDGITRLKTLKPYKFNFKVEPDKTVDGFFAHEVTPAVPEAISGTKDEVDSDGNPIYQGIDQSKLVPLLTAALQEAIGKIEVLEAKVAALEGA